MEPDTLEKEEGREGGGVEDLTHLSVKGLSHWSMLPQECWIGVHWESQEANPKVPLY